MEFFEIPFQFLSYCCFPREHFLSSLIPLSESQETPPPVKSMSVEPLCTLKAVLVSFLLMGSFVAHHTGPIFCCQMLGKFPVLLDLLLAIVSFLFRKSHPHKFIYRPVDPLVLFSLKISFTFVLFASPPLSLCLAVTSRLISSQSLGKLVVEPFLAARAFCSPADVLFSKDCVKA